MRSNPIRARYFSTEVTRDLRFPTPLVLAALLGLSDNGPPDPGAAAFGDGFRAMAGDDPGMAAIEFTRCLDDGAIPESRRARALYNRGTARALAGGTSAELIAACGDLRDCLATAATPQGVRADARNNLEVAKLLLAAARAREAREKSPPRANSPREVPGDNESEEPGAGLVATAIPQPATVPTADGVGEPGQGSAEPGKSLRPPNPVPVADPPPVSASVARNVLESARARIARNRVAAAKLRPATGGGNARDW